MKPTIATLILLITSFHSFAQNYFPFHKSDLYYFSDSLKTDAFALKIDSVKSKGQDSIFFTHKQIGIEPNCNFNIYGTSWLGDSILVKQDGSCIFTNKTGKTFLVSTKASLNAKWVAYETEKWKAQLTVSKITKESCLDFTDSIKTFTINILKTDNSDTSHAYDGLTIKLSKEHGWVKLLNFHSWDLDVNDIILFEQDLLSLNLTGSENKKKTLFNFTGKDIFNFEVGDVFHVVTSATFGYTSRRDDIDSIMSKQTTDSSYIYTIQHFTQYIPKTAQGAVTEYKTDTILVKYNFNFQANLPKTVFQQQVLSIFSYSSNLESWGKAIGDINYIFYGNKSIANCKGSTPPWVSNVYSGHVDYYYDGLGGPYYSYSLQNNSGPYIKKLVYYKKGGIEWNETPLGIDEIKPVLSNSITYSPNPAKETVHFHVNGTITPITIYLIDMKGNIVHSKTFEEDYTMNVSELNKGLYFFYTLTNAKKNGMSGKIVID